MGPIFHISNTLVNNTGVSIGSFITYTQLHSRRMNGLVFTALGTTVAMVFLCDYSAVSGADFLTFGDSTDEVEARALYDAAEQ